MENTSVDPSVLTPLSAGVPEIFQCWRKGGGGLALFEFLGEGRLSKNMGVDFVRGGLMIFCKQFSTAGELSHEIKNLNYNNNHNHIVLYLFTCFKCLQLVN